MSALPFPSAGMNRLILGDAPFGFRPTPRGPLSRDPRPPAVHPHQAGDHLARPATNAGRPVFLLRRRLSRQAFDVACVPVYPIHLPHPDALSRAPSTEHGRFRGCAKRSGLISP